MSESRGSHLMIRRIVVAVDASPHSQAALEAAIDMASRFEAELLALFVEDIDVLRAAGFPFAHEVGEHSALRRRVELSGIERNLRARSRRIEEAFQALARQGSVRGRFRVARGNVRTEIQNAAQEADVLIVGRAGWSQVRRRRLGSTARAACSSDAPGVTVILREGEHIISPILVVYDGSALCDHALGIAAALVERLGNPLIVLLLAEWPGQAEALRARATAQLQPYDVIRQYLVAAAREVPVIADTIRGVAPGTLVLPAKLTPFDGDVTLDLIEAVELPVLLIR